MNFESIQQIALTGFGALALILAIRAACLHRETKKHRRKRETLETIRALIEAIQNFRERRDEFEPWQSEWHQFDNEIEECENYLDKLLIQEGYNEVHLICPSPY